MQLGVSSFGELNWSFSTMSEEATVSVVGVSKSYPLFRSQREQLAYLMLPKFLRGRFMEELPTHSALESVSLDVPRGSRLGIIGRNGSGKTTLLRILLGVTDPTDGYVTRRGHVQALMSSGVGFHPEFAAEENIRSALAYRGLNRTSMTKIVRDVKDFAELGDYWAQPFRTYSLGMRARLMFAVATSVPPDVLVVDEILGAGDAYFIEKSRMRIQRLVEDGLTLVLVSHSMQQILELCTRAMWLDKGRVVAEGEAFEVVKAYEEHVYSSAAMLERPDKLTSSTLREDVSNDHESNWMFRSPNAETVSLPKDQEPRIAAQHKIWDVRRTVATPGFGAPAKGGISRWVQPTSSVRIVGFQIETPDGPSAIAQMLKPVLMRVTLESNSSGTASLRLGIVVSDYAGRTVMKLISPIYSAEWTTSEIRDFCVVLDPLQLGVGEYVVGISVLEATTIEEIQGAKILDLLSRSFKFSVEAAFHSAFTEVGFVHSGSWYFPETLKSIPDDSGNRKSKDESGDPIE